MLTYSTKYITHSPFLPDLRQTQYFILLHKILMSFQTFYLFLEEPETRFIDIYRLYLFLYLFLSISQVPGDGGYIYLETLKQINCFTHAFLREEESNK